MATENRHITRIETTEALFRANGDHGQSAILSDVSDNWSYWNAAKNKQYYGANQYYWNGAAIVYCDVEFNDIEAHGDFLADEYIKRAAGTDDYIRFENDKITIAAGGVDTFAFEDDKVYTALNTGIKTSVPDYELDVAGSIGIDDYLHHNDDADTYFYFSTDRIMAYVGGEYLLDLYEGVQDYVKLGDGGDVDINLNDFVFVEGSTGNVGIRTTIPDSLLHIHRASAGTVTAHAFSALVVEHNDNVAISILTPNNKKQHLLFGDTDLNTVGQLYYNHTDDSCGIVTNSVLRSLFNSDGIAVYGNCVSVTPITATEYGYFSLTNTGGTVYFGLERSIGAGLFAGSAAYQCVIGHTGNYPLGLYTNNLQRLHITAAGDVGIGTTAPLLNVGSATGDFDSVSGGLHIKATTGYNARLILEGGSISTEGYRNAANSIIFCNTSTITADDRIMLIGQDNGVTDTSNLYIRSLDADGTVGHTAAYFEQTTGYSRFTRSYFSVDAFITSPTARLTIAENADDSTCGILDLANDRDNPADNDEVGRIQMLGDDGAHSIHSFCEIVGRATDVSAGSEDGDLTLSVFSGGNYNKVYMKIDGLNTKFAFHDGYMHFETIRSGATQGGAGAAANEVWKTSGHATLPNNVLMIGV